MIPITLFQSLDLCNCISILFMKQITLEVNSNPLCFDRLSNERCEKCSFYLKFFDPSFWVIKLEMGFSCWRQAPRTILDNVGAIRKASWTLQAFHRLQPHMKGWMWGCFKKPKVSKMMLDTYVQTPLTNAEANVLNSWCLSRRITSKAVVTSGQQSELAGFGEASCHPRPITISTFLQQTLKHFQILLRQLLARFRRVFVLICQKWGSTGNCIHFPSMMDESRSLYTKRDLLKLLYKIYFAYLHAHTIHTEINKS